LIEQLRTLSLETLPPFTPDDPTLAANSSERSFTHWVRDFANKNGYGHLNKSLASIFADNAKAPTTTITPAFEQQLNKLLAKIVPPPAN
jgi:hypothetical protein